LKNVVLRIYEKGIYNKEGKRDWGECKSINLMPLSKRKLVDGKLVCFFSEDSKFVGIMIK